jgi:hypothetical protein
MMVLSGAMFPFDKLNRKVGSVEKVPVIAEIMPTRWTYEALMVSQFKDNSYSTQEFNTKGETYYTLQKKISQAEFNKMYRIPELKKATTDPNKLPLLRNELAKMTSVNGGFRYMDDLTPEKFNSIIADSARVYLDKQYVFFNQISNSTTDLIDKFINYDQNKSKLKKLRDDYFNSSLKDIVTKPYERKKILFYKKTIVQNVDPVYLDPVKRGFLGFRTHFYAPCKYIFGVKVDTFTFNICLVLLSTILLYLLLYFELLAKLVMFIERFKLRKRFFKDLVS